MTPSEELNRIRDLHYANCIERSEKSLSDFLACVMIDSRPIAKPWGEIIEPWQVKLLEPIIPAIEKMAGNRTEHNGSRHFFFVLPRGHDKTGLIGRITLWCLAFAKHQISAVACACDLGQADLLRKSMAAEVNLNPWMQDRIDVKGYSVEGPHGVLKIIASDAGGSSGEKCDLIICDEITWWKKRELFDVLFSGSEKRPDCVFIILTNAGIMDTWQHQLLLTARKDPAWKVFESPVDRTMASWMTTEGIARLRSMLAPAITRRVLDNRWVNSTESPLIQDEWLVACTDPATLWKDHPKVVNYQYFPEFYVGVDYGRTKDLTVITVIELLDGIAWVRELRVLENTPFDRQVQAIRSVMTRQVVKCCMDKGGLGMAPTEAIEGEFGLIAEGIFLSATRRGQIAARIRTMFEQGLIRIPDDPTLRQDIQQVQELATTSGGVPVIEVDRTGIGHADRFWSIALAVFGLPMDLIKKHTSLPRGVQSKYAPKRARF